MRNCNDTVVGSESEYESIMEIRDKLANTILTCVVVLGIPIILISFLRYLKVGGLFILIVHFTLYFLCLSVTIRRKKTSFKAKSILVISCTFVMAGASIMKWGITGSGIAYYIFCSILVTIFYGATSGIVITLLDLVIMIIAAILFNTGYLQYNFNINNFFSTLPTWIYALSVYGCFTIVLVVCLGRLYNSMTASIKNLANRTSELHVAKEQMETEIKNRKQAETALQESEERFRIVLENLPVGVFVHDLEGNNLIVNDEACKSTGYSKEELLTKTVEDTGSASFNMDEARKTWAQLAETGETMTFESASHRKDGFTYDTEVHLKSVILQGSPVILVIVFNIAERKKAEVALRESEERFRTVLENLPCGVSVHDLEGRHLIVNEETCRVKGYTREELLNLTIMETAGPALGTHYNVTELWQNIEPGASFTFETLTQRKDKSLYDSEVHLTKIILEGQPVILSLVFDITERKKIEESLARRSDLERLISEISSRIVGMSHYEVDTYINEALAVIGKKTGVDHAYLFLLQPDRDLFYSINEWCSDNTVPQIEALQGVQPEKDFPWFTEVIQSQDFVHVPDVAELPPEAQKEREYFQNRSIKSLVVIAMRQGENLIGFLGFDNIYETKTWSEDEIVIFRIIGEAFTSAIQRKQAEREQEKLQAQLSNAVDLAHLGPWELDVEKRMFTFNDHFYKIYHTTAEEMGGYTMSLDEYAHKFIHPDDMHVVDRSERMGRDPNAEPERVEHRMFYADGSPGICNVPDVPCKK